MPRIDLDNAQLVLLLDTLRNIEDERVDELYQLIRDRTPMDFDDQLRALFAQGLDDVGVLEALDPDTAGTDLVALVRKLMAPVSTHLVSCCLCHQETPEATAHVHGAMWVCDECWDEGLRTTS